MGLLDGKRGVILGVANDKSIAWACAKACAAEGASLVFNFLGEPLERRVRALVDKEIPGSPVFPCDASDDASIEAFFKSVDGVWDGIDFVVHSLAFAKREDLKGRFVDTSRAGFALALDVSAYSLVAVTREAAARMPQGGAVVAMTYYGAEKVIPHYNVMGVAKAALEASARYLAADLGPNGVRVNCVSAGPIRTLSSSAIADIKTMLDTAERVAPLRRNTTQDDVGRSTVYLVSDLSAGVTGEVLHVDCGYNVLGLFGQLPEQPE